MTSKAKVGGSTLSIGVVLMPIFIVFSAPIAPYFENMAIAEPRFSNYEIRVIKPRFFSKVKDSACNHKDGRECGAFLARSPNAYPWRAFA